jgi:hypothetical protein
MEHAQTNQAAALATVLVPDWLPVKDFIASPVGGQFFQSYTAFQWLLRHHRRRLIESGAVMKTGKRLTVSTSRAPAIIEAIYREQTLAALDRSAA